jgi:hypothetical protein
VAWHWRGSRRFNSLCGLAAGALAGAIFAGVSLAQDSGGGLQTRAYAPLVAADSAPAIPQGLTCGEERWDVKTLSDPAAISLSYAPVDTTVDALRALPKPPVGQSTPRMPGVQSTTYRITVSLKLFKVEDDRDIHLVVADLSDPTHTMIVEFPDIACEGPNRSAQRDTMDAARAALVAACGSPNTSSFKNLTGTATLTGVGFFDIIHGQTGVAPNGIELHPVLSFSGSPDSASVGARRERVEAAQVCRVRAEPHAGDARDAVAALRR